MISNEQTQVSVSLAKNSGATLLNKPTIEKTTEEKFINDTTFNDHVIKRQTLKGASETDVAMDTLYRLFSSKWDYIVNRFTAILFWYNGQSLESDYFRTMGDSTLSNKLSVYDNNKANSILTKEGFYIRFGQIEIPQAINQTFEISIGEVSIQKLRSSKDMTKKVNFTFRLDDNLEWLNFFEKGAGINDTIKEDKNSEKHIYEYNFIKNKLSIKNSISFITRSFSVGSNVKDQKLCLAICADDFNTSIMMKKDKRTPLWYYLFEDIRFLGVDNGIEYNVDNSGSTDITVSFIYKRVRKLNLQNIRI